MKKSWRKRIADMGNCPKKCFETGNCLVCSMKRQQVASVETNKQRKNALKLRKK